MRILFTLFILLFASASFAEDAPQPPQPEEKEEFRFSRLFTADEMKRKPDDEKRWYFTLAGMYTRKKGNTDSLDSSLSSSVRYDDNIIESTLSYNGSYGETKRVRDENKGSVYGGFDWYLLSRVEFFVYSLFDYDRVTGLVCRDVAGCGGKFVFVRNRFWKADLSGAPVHQYERYRWEGYEREWRWSIRGRVILAPGNETFGLRYVYFRIPLMRNLREYRESHDLSATFTPGGKLMFKAGYRHEYDSAIPATKKKTDTKYYFQAGVSL